MNRRFTKVEVKTCGTCLFWKGGRELTKLENGKPAYRFKNKLERLPCENIESRCYKDSRNNGESCSKHKSAYKNS